MRFQSYFNTALQLISAYKGEMPLAHYLKNYFAQHKKHGSKDRKFIAHLCYCYYRLGHALKNISAEERLKAAIFLCNDTITAWALLFTDEWLASHDALLENRIVFLNSKMGFTVNQIFPWHGLLSEDIDAELFAKSHLIQPDLFLRTRPGKKETVVAKLRGSNIKCTEINETCLALPNNSQVDKILALNKEAVVQDYSSQQIATFLHCIQPETGNLKPETRFWDCCAASGGKSILAFDIFEDIHLTVSDIRPAMINNLQERFKEAGIKNYTSFVADLAHSPLIIHRSPFTIDDSRLTTDDSRFTIHHSRFDLILCDAPCTGSGTWSRTPEQLYFFSPDEIARFAALQQKIVSTVLPYVKKDGYFLYITCSVFAEENEKCVEHITQHGLCLLKKSVLPGYDRKADTMFAALFKK